VHVIIFVSVSFRLAFSLLSVLIKISRHDQDCTNELCIFCQKIAEIGHNSCSNSVYEKANKEIENSLEM